MKKQVKHIEIDETRYRQFIAAISAIVELFPDETEKKLKEKRERERKRKIVIDTQKMIAVS